MKDEVKAIPEAVHDILRREMFGMLTTMARDGLPSTNPVSFVFDGTSVRVSTLKSRRKYTNICNDDRVALCVQSSSNPMNYVEVRGRATLTDDADREFLRQQWKVHSGGMEPPDDLDPADAERVTITILPTAVSSPTLYEGRLDRYFEDERRST